MEYSSSEEPRDEGVGDEALRHEPTDEPGEPCSTATDGSSSDSGGTGGTRWRAKGGDSHARTGEAGKGSCDSFRSEADCSESDGSEPASEVATVGRNDGER